VLTTWQRGRTLVTDRRRQEEGPLPGFVDELHARTPPVPRVPGTAVFLNRGNETAPLALRATVTHLHVLPSCLVILSIETVPVPYVRAEGGSPSMTSPGPTTGSAVSGALILACAVAVIWVLAGRGSVPVNWVVFALTIGATAAVVLVAAATRVPPATGADQDLRGREVTAAMVGELNLRGQDLSGALLDGLDLRSKSLAGAVAKGPRSGGRGWRAYRCAAPTSAEPT
jgi:hypothetical protein